MQKNDPLIILDISNLLYASVYGLAANDHSEDMMEENFLRHMFLNSIRNNFNQFKREYDKNLVIACDSPNSWRKEVFPYYKASRKASRDASKVNWKKIFPIFEIVLTELATHFPYKVIRANRAEADDIIATIVHARNASQKTLIISTDKDNGQLHYYENVKQYNPITKTFVDRVEDPLEYLKEHVLRGDRSDGVPNFLSDGDTFVTPNKRQRPLSRSFLDSKRGVFDSAKLAGNDPTLMANIKRNEVLIDLRNTPEEIKNEIMAKYNQPIESSGSLINYFIEKRLRELIGSINDFV